MLALACAHCAHVGTPLTRFVAPSGAPPKAHLPTLACAHRAHFGTTLTSVARGAYDEGANNCI
eukprot:2851718-Pyramimonas_sp.AAC.1